MQAMWGRRPLTLPIQSLVLGFIAFCIQLVALVSSHWVLFNARTDLGKPEETGHVGLWSVCSRKANRGGDDCDPMDTFYEQPNTLRAAGVLAAVHTVSLVAALPLVVIRIAQACRGVEKLGLTVRAVVFSRLGLALTSIALNIIILVLASLGHEANKTYLVSVGWTYWVQVSILALSLAQSGTCGLELVQLRGLWKLERRIKPPTDLFPNLHVLGTPPPAHIAVTDCSGEPPFHYQNPTFNDSSPNRLYQVSLETP